MEQWLENMTAILSHDSIGGFSVTNWALAALVLVTEPANRITGRVTYSQQILKEMSVIDEAEGTGTEGGRIGSGYSQI